MPVPGKPRRGHSFPATTTGNAVLVIGAHREELGFGERVAEGLPRDLIEVYRIPEGISGRHPREDESFR